MCKDCVGPPLLVDADGVCVKVDLTGKMARLGQALIEFRAPGGGTDGKRGGISSLADCGPAAKIVY